MPQLRKLPSRSFIGIFLMRPGKEEQVVSYSIQELCFMDII